MDDFFKTIAGLSKKQRQKSKSKKAKSTEQQQNTRNVLVKALKDIKEEINKRHSIKQLHGIDLANYENKYLTVALDLVYFLLGNELSDEIDWWIFDSSEKVYYDSKTHDVIANVELADDFVDYHLNSRD